MSYGGTSGSSRIATAADAALSNPQTADALIYNSGTQKWSNGSVTKVSGVTISGTPSNGQSLVATSSSAATWQTVSGGSSSGNVDGGSASSTYGGTIAINGGGA